MNKAAGKPRARDLGLPFAGKTGTFNAITDIPGVTVGFTTLIEGEGPVQVGEGPIRTGVTAILPRGDRDIPHAVWAGRFNLNGNGEMTGAHWIDEAGYFIGPICITNTHSVGIAHHAAAGWMIDRYKRYFQGGHAWAMPVIAETYDGLTNDICGRHVKEDHVLAALASAASGFLQEGSVGGGAGMLTYEFKGGTGSSSRMVSIGSEEYTVGVLVQSNFGARKDLTILGAPVGECMPENAVYSLLGSHEKGSIIAIIGTDLPLLPTQLRRVARRGAIGVGRTGAPGGNYSGDLFLAFSTANDAALTIFPREQPAIHAMDAVDNHYLDDIFRAVVRAVEEAIINAMVAAESMTTVKPAGYTVDAIDHDRLRAIMKQYNRLEEKVIHGDR